MIGSCSNIFTASSIQAISSALILTFCHLNLSYSTMLKTITRAEVSFGKRPITLVLLLTSLKARSIDITGTDMFPVVLEEEVTDFLGCQRYERHRGNRRGYRNGLWERQVSCGAGEVEVAMPRVPDTKEAFHSQLLEAWQRRSRLLEETIPLLYIEGLSTRDFKRALKSLRGKSGLSRSSISRANRVLKEAFNNWRHRDLSLEEIVYLFLDVIYLGVRGTSRHKEVILVVHGINREGKRG